jgi:hypothetical protein
MFTWARKTATEATVRSTPKATARHTGMASSTSGRFRVRAIRRSRSRSRTLLKVPLAAIASTPPEIVVTTTPRSSAGPAASAMAARATNDSNHHSFGLVSVR